MRSISSEIDRLFKYRSLYVFVVESCENREFNIGIYIYFFL